MGIGRIVAPAGSLSAETSRGSSAYFLDLRGQHWQNHGGVKSLNLGPGIIASVWKIHAAW
jgi:hypothetical protein